VTGRRTAQVLLALGGMFAWAVQFTLIYGAISTLCGRGWADATLLGIGVVPFAILSTTLVTPASATDAFLSQTGVLINGLSLIAILWNGVPAFILPACA
jgi:hypothetical protein